MLTEDAAADFRALEGRSKKLVAKQLKNLGKSPITASRTEISGGSYLTGFYKLYADRKSIRVVYRKVGHG